MRLGNTRTVCKKYYVHQAIPDLYAKKELEKFFVADKTANKWENFSEAERILMEILQTL